MKRSFLMALAVALIASVAFSAPSQAATVFTMGFFALEPTSATASEWTFNYVDSNDTPLANMSGLSIISTGGLTILSDTIVSPGTVDITFSPANHTTGAPIPLTPGLEFSFATTNAVNDVFMAGAHLTTSGASVVVNVSGINVVPEPSSMALLALGVGALLMRLGFFRRSSVA